MKTYKAFSIIFAILAILLSDIMCAVVAFGYCNLRWGGQYLCWSAPASTAFYYAIPYIAGIVVCIALTVFFRKKQGKSAEV